MSEETKTIKELLEGRLRAAIETGKPNEVLTLIEAVRRLTDHKDSTLEDGRVQILDMLHDSYLRLECKRLRKIIDDDPDQERVEQILNDELGKRIKEKLLVTIKHHEKKYGKPFGQLVEEADLKDKKVVLGIIVDEG